MRAVVTSVLAAAAILSAAQSAHAWTPPPADDAARVALYLPIARAAWPGSPCAGVSAENVQIVAALPGSAVGEQDPGTCNVRLLAGRTAEKLCDTLVHELGHAAGYGHTDDPLEVHAPDGPQAEIMSSTGARWPACVSATTPSARYAAEQYVRELLPAAPSWQVSCTPMRHKPTCRARRAGARDRRFDVLLTARGVVLGVAPIARS